MQTYTFSTAAKRALTITPSMSAASINISKRSSAKTRRPTRRKLTSVSMPVALSAIATTKISALVRNSSSSRQRVAASHHRGLAGPHHACLVAQKRAPMHRARINRRAVELRHLQRGRSVAQARPWTSFSRSASNKRSSCLRRKWALTR